MVTSLAPKKKQSLRPKTEVLSQEELRTWWPFDRVDGKILEKLNRRHLTNKNRTYHPFPLHPFRRIL